MDNTKNQKCSRPLQRRGYTSGGSPSFQTCRVHGSKKSSDVLYPTPLVGQPILHDELGLVKAWLTRLEKFADCRVEVVPTEEVATREHLVSRTIDWEDLV